MASHDVAYLASFQIKLVLYVRSNLGARFCRAILLSSFHLLSKYPLNRIRLGLASAPLQVVYPFPWEDQFL